MTKSKPLKITAPERVTQREYFAAVAMLGLIQRGLPGDRMGHIDYDALCNTAVDFADALHAALTFGEVTE
ncbi:hypothetical protein [Deinococcus ruber]|uniref:Uncharacterized protein n=1 Tax=Deinococcus ruber TaxID=1848197 RepID=A0A918F744_9DEIO|nr:hypothetical protein [Deinococcus ruber]GGR11600.1 hypothetical protein GCM10008957_25730 [Deinococcus ruber]